MAAELKTLRRRSRRSAILAHASALYSNLFLSAGFDSHAARARQSLERFLYFATSCIEILAGPKPLQCLSLSRPPFGKQRCCQLGAEHQSKHSTELCCPRSDTARLDRTNADQRSERSQGHGVFVDLNKHDTVSPSVRASRVNHTSTVQVPFSS